MNRGISLNIKFGGISRAFSYKNYRYYWIGGAVSILGFWLSKIALGLLTWQLTNSPFWLGVIGFLATFPAAFFAPFAGAIADYYGLRKVAMFALSASAINALILGILTYLNLITIEILAVLVLVQGTTLAFDLPSRQALVHYAVAKEDISSAIALNTTTFHLGAFIGPGLFAILNPIFGISFAFFFNSFTFLIFGIALAAMKLNRHLIPVKGGQTIFSNMYDGIRYTVRHSTIILVLALTAASHILIRPYIDLLPAFSDLIFKAGENGFAMLAGASGFGSLCGGLWLSIRGKNDGLIKVLCFGILTSAISVFLFSLTNNFLLGMICMVALGFSLITMAVASQSLIQNTVDPTKRARVISLSTGIAVGFPAVGALILGSFGEIYGIQSPVLISALICLVYSIPIAKSLLCEGKALGTEKNNIIK